jgi:hypothetical protein
MPRDPDFIGACAAIERSAQRALDTALQLGTPCWVMEDGKIVDLAARYHVLVQAALNDPRPGIPNDEARRHFARRREALRKKVEQGT